MNYNTTAITNSIRDPIKSIKVNNKEEKLNLIGQGSTCLVYINENQTAIYKEFFPLLHNYIPAFRRSESGDLIKLSGIEKNIVLSEVYEKSYNRFWNSIVVANEIYETYKAKNADMRIYPLECDIQGDWQKFNANKGDVYYNYLLKKRAEYVEKCREFFAAVLNSVCLMTRDVGMYHNARGKAMYINLDIKPQNMFVLYNDANKISAVRNLDFGSALNIPQLLVSINMEYEKNPGDADTVASNIIKTFFSTTEQFYHEGTLRRTIKKCIESNDDTEKLSELIRLDAIAVLKILIYSLSGDLDNDVVIELGDENLHLKGKLREIFASHNVTGSKNLFEEYNCYFHLYDLITYVFTNNDAENMMVEFENRLQDILCMLGKRPGTDALTQRQIMAIAQNEIFAAAGGELTQRKLKTVDDICDFADEAGLWVPASPAELNYYFTVGTNREVLRAGGSAESGTVDSWSGIFKKKIDLKLFADIVCGEKTYTVYDEKSKRMKESADIPLIQAYDSIEGKKRLLVIGDASQGKSTSLRMFAAEQLYRNKLCLLYQCRDFHGDKDFEDIKSRVERAVSVAKEKSEAAAADSMPVLVFDAYDELAPNLRGAFLDMLKYLDTSDVDIVISSRYNFINGKREDDDVGVSDEWEDAGSSFDVGDFFSYNGIDREREESYINCFENEYMQMQMLPFGYEQLDSLVDKSVNRESEYFKLLGMTMLLAMHLNFEKAQMLGKIESKIKTEVAFINGYFSLLASKKTDCAYDDDYQRLGEYVCYQRGDHYPQRVTRIPNYLKDILFYRNVKRRGGNGKGGVKELDAINLKYLNFFEANYIMGKFVDCLDTCKDELMNERAVVVLRHMFLPETDETNEVLYYVGQLLAEKGYDEAAVFELFSKISRSYNTSMICSFILGFCNGEVRDIGKSDIFDIITSVKSSWQETAFVRSHIRAITTKYFKSSYIEFCKDGFPSLEEISVNNSEFRTEGNCLIKRRTGEVWLGFGKSVIPEGVSIIRKNAFSYCTRLTEVKIPDSVMEIDSLAFKRCEALERVEIGSGVRRIHEAAFYHCTNLRTVVFKAADMQVDDRGGCHKYAFSKSDNIEDMTLPTTALIYPFHISNNEVKTLRVFEGNEYGRPRSLSFTDIPRYNNFREFYISADVSSISDDAFSKRYNCLEKIEVEEGNQNYYSVDNCLINKKTKCLMLGCKNSIIPDDGSVTEIGAYAFATVDGMRTVEIGEHITNIGDYAFAGCNDLEVVDVKGNPKMIGLRAFSFNTTLKTVRIADADGWSQVFFSNIPSNPVCFARKIELPKEAEKTVRIKEGRTQISAGAFRYGTGFEKVVLPSSMEVIGGTAFLECTDLKDVYIEDLKAWCKISFLSYSANPLSNNARLWVNDTQIKEIKFGKDIEKIGKGCFVRCKDLESICFEGDTKIGELAFDACMDLKKVVFKSPNVKIEEDAFSKCNVDVYFCGTREQWELAGGNMLLGVNNVTFEDQ